MTEVALVHDYLTQRGGAERVVAAMCRTFPEAPLYTSLYAPELTFPEFAGGVVRTLPLNRSRLLRRRHRLALPLLAPSFSRLRIDADVLVCSSSGWAHGAAVSGRKLVYCHTPARWLYQADRYIGERGVAARPLLALLAPGLRRWDRAAARSADRYLANSSVVRERIRLLYGVDADVLPPPPAVTPGGEAAPVAGVEPGFVLCVSRLLPYKNVSAVCEAFTRLPKSRLVVAGDGPELATLRRDAPANVIFLARVDDATLRWLYDSCSGLVSASYEDFGLTPLEAAGFGRPSAVLRFGGFLDTVVEEETGVFFDEPTPAAVAAAIERLLATSWTPDLLRHHAARFAESRFAARLREIVAQESQARLEG